MRETGMFYSQEETEPQTLFKVIPVSESTWVTLSLGLIHQGLSVLGNWSISPTDDAGLQRRIQVQILSLAQFSIMADATEPVFIESTSTSNTGKGTKRGSQHLRGAPHEGSPGEEGPF